MNCKQARNHFLFCMDGSLHEAESAALQEHLAGCKACTLLFANIKETYNAFDNATVPEINPYIVSKIEAKLRTPSIEIDVARLPFKKVFPKVAASAVLIIGIALGVFVGEKMQYLHTSSNDSNLNEVVKTYTDVYKASYTSPSTDALLANE